MEGTGAVLAGPLLTASRFGFIGLEIQFFIAQSISFRHSKQLLIHPVKCILSKCFIKWRIQMTEQFRNLLIIDDEVAMRHMLRLVLEPHNYRVTEADNGAVALGIIRQEKFDVILSDIRMPDMDGLSFLDHPEVNSLDSTIIMMSAYGSVDTALECMKRGAYDYISKPFKPDEVLLTLRKAEERQLLRQENRQLKTALSKQDKAFSIDQIVHSSVAMQQVLQMVRAAAAADSPVLISGETGTGKGSFDMAEQFAFQ
jgi:two-component system response regulator AtoC